MRHLQLAFGIIGAILLTLVIIISISGKSEREQELNNNLSSAVEETVEITTIDQKYTINNVNEYIADFIEGLSERLDSDSGIKVEILGVDKEKGLLSIRVANIFEYPNGKQGEVSCERNVILNTKEDITEETYKVTFFVKKEDIGTENAYKSYQVLEGSTVAAPVEPASASGTFAGWKDAEDYLADFAVPVTGDLIYYAAWN